MSADHGLLDQLAEEIARRAAAIVLEGLAAEREQGNGDGWVDALGAAKHVGVSRERIYKLLPELPHSRWGGRLLFRRSDLDAFLDERREP